MEWLNQMSIKKSYYYITFLFFLGAFLLSIISIIGISHILQFNGPAFEITMEDEKIKTNLTEPDYPIWYHFLSALQFIIPTIYILIALALANWVFYHTKIEKPLAELAFGTDQIMHNYLDFSIKVHADDELGRVCHAFETMRLELLKNNKALWKHLEERKRLNAAFSHDLRNPITVIKGAVNLMKKGITEDKLTIENVDRSLLLFEKYIRRIEAYVEIMSNIQRLEEIECKKEQVLCRDFIQELSKMLLLLCNDKELIIDDTDMPNDKFIWVDKFMIHNILESIVSNSLRYAKNQIEITFSCDNSQLHFIVQDDGDGFPDKILSRGAEPFHRGNETTNPSEHFGIGLYICKLLCEKHGGQLILQNTNLGARVTVSLNILET